MRRKGFREGARDLVFTLIFLIIIIIALIRCPRIKRSTSAYPRTINISKITWRWCVSQCVHVIRGDMPLPVMMVIYRILATLVIDNKLVEPALVCLYPIKPLIKTAHTHGGVVVVGKEAKRGSGLAWWGGG